MESTTYLIASVLNLSRGKVEGEHSNCIRILVGNNQVLTAVVELEVTWSLSAGVEEAHLREGTTRRSRRRLSSLLATGPLMDAENGNGLMAAIRDNDKPSRLMHT